MSKNVVSFAGSLLKICTTILPNFLTKPMISRSSDRTKEQILVESVKSGNKGIFDFLMKKNVRLDFVNDKQENLLHLATKYGRTEIVQDLLLRNKEIINTKDAQGETPLFNAVRQANLDICNMLLDNGINIQVLNKGGKDVLDYFYEAFNKTDPDKRLKLLEKSENNYVRREENVGKALIKNWEQQVRIEDVKSKHFSKIFDNIMLNSSPEAFKKFLEVVLKSDENYIKNREKAGANFAIDLLKSQQKADRISEKIKILAENGADIKSSSGENHGGKTPLQVAYYEGKTQCFKALLGLGADINDADSRGRTLLHRVCQLPPHEEAAGLYDKITRVLALGADPKIKDLQEHTAREYIEKSDRVLSTVNYDGVENFHAEDKNHYYDILNFWGAGDDPLSLNKMINEQGQTNFHIIVQAGNPKDIENVLGKKELNPNLKDNRGMTPLFYAVIKGDVELVRDLYKYQRSTNSERKIDDIINIVNQQDKEGKTLLHHAVHNGNIEVVKFLLEKKPNLNLVDNEGKTPIFTALQNNHLEIIGLLAEEGVDVNMADKKSNVVLDKAKKHETQALDHSETSNHISPKEQKSSPTPKNITPNETPEVKKTKGKKPKGTEIGS